MSQLDSYEVDPVFGCRWWTGRLGNNGRPIIWAGRKPINAYKVAYEKAYGLVKDGEVIDHLCRRVLCIRALHLEAVTQHENLLRRSWAYRCKRTHCARGHELASALVTPEMGRLCRTCAADAS